jgi:glycosyltransferase involved in cell wall biosynthesis
LPVLIKAVELARKAGAGVTADVYGPGDSSVYAPVQGITLRGNIEFGKVQQVVGDYDLLVLPSLHDGWGVVVNEALLQGVPVLLSDAVGARTLVEVSGAGGVFASGCDDQLALLLIELAKTPGKIEALRIAAQRFKTELLPETAANYLYECLLYAGGESSIRPRSPWYP